MGKFALPCHVSKDIILSNLLNQDVSSLILNHVKKQENIDEIKFRTDITDTFKDTYGPDWTRIMRQFHRSPLFKKLHPEYEDIWNFDNLFEEYFNNMYNNMWPNPILITYAPPINVGIQQIYLQDNIQQPINNNVVIIDEVIVDSKYSRKERTKQMRREQRAMTKHMRHENRAMMKRMRKGSFKH